MSDTVSRQIGRRQIGSVALRQRNATLLGIAFGLNFNSTADQAIKIRSKRYRITRIMVTNASISLTTAAGGFYNGTGKPAGGVLVAAGQVYTALTAAAKFVDATLGGVAVTDIQTADPIYLSLTTAQGAAATADVYVYGERLDS